MNALTPQTTDAARTSRAGAVARSTARLAGLLALTVLAASEASASGGAAMPWDGPLQTLADALTGNTVRLVAVIAIAMGGIIWAFTRNEEGAKRIGQAVLGLGIAIGATTFAATLGISGASF